VVVEEGEVGSDPLIFLYPLNALFVQVLVAVQEERFDPDQDSVAVCPFTILDG